MSQLNFWTSLAVSSSRGFRLYPIVDFLSVNCPTNTQPVVSWSYSCRRWNGSNQRLEKGHRFSNNLWLTLTLQKFCVIDVIMFRKRNKMRIDFLSAQEKDSNVNVEWNTNSNWSALSNYEQYRSFRALMLFCEYAVRWIENYAQSIQSSYELFQPFR